MIAALLIAIAVVLLVANSRETEEAGISSGCNAGIWLLAIVAFVVLLAGASVIGGLAAGG